MPEHGEPHIVGGAGQSSLEQVVAECLDATAVVAHDVVVVVAARIERLEARRPLTKVETLRQPELDEQVESAVDARDADRAPALPQAIDDLLNGEAAGLLPEQADHRGSRSPAAIAGGT